MRRWSLLAIALSVYAALELPAAIANADRINPDAVSYLRHALYWTQGRIADAISPSWSPLLSWCVAPLLGAGDDGLHAAYLVLGLWGAVLVFAAWLLLDRLGEVPVWLGGVMLALVAEGAVTWSAVALPDVILAACLMLYAAAALSPRLFERRRPAVWAGIFAGLAYLSKAYAFPFFLLHWPLTVALFAWARGIPRRRAVGIALTGAIAFGAIALPWAALLTWKMEKPTFGVLARSDPRDELWEPVSGRVTVWEIPESRAVDGPTARRRVAHAGRTLDELRDTLQGFDALGAGLVLVLLGPFLAWALGRGREEIERSAWGAMTVVVYAVPLLLFAFTDRTAAPWLQPITILFALHATWRIAERLPRAVAAGLLVVVLGSFLAGANVPFRPYTVEEPGGTSFNDVTVDSRPHRVTAERFHASGIGGPLASTGYWAGMYLGFFLDAPFVGSPAGATPRACEEELAAAGVQTFIVDRTWKFAPVFEASREWRNAATIRTPSGEAWDVYVRGQNGQVYTQSEPQASSVHTLPPITTVGAHVVQDGGFGGFFASTTPPLTSARPTTARATSARVFFIVSSRLWDGRAYLQGAAP